MAGLAALDTTITRLPRGSGGPSSTRAVSNSSRTRADPDHTGLLVERRGGGVRRCRRPGRRRSACGGRQPSGDAGELPRVAEALRVEEDDRRLRVVLPVLQQVVAADVGPVAERDEAGQADAEPRGHLQDARAERAGLQRDRDAATGDPGGRQHGPQRRRPARGEDAHARRPDDPHARCRGPGSRGAGSSGLALAAASGEIAGDDDQPPDVLRDGVVEHRLQLVRRHGDDGQRHVVGHRRAGWDSTACWPPARARGSPRTPVRRSHCS